MHSFQSLFGREAGSLDLLSHESFLNRARAERARENDVASRQALGAYLVARLIDRLLELDGSDESAQGFAWQIEGCRRFTADLPADDPEVSHLRGIIEAVKGDPVHRAAVVRVTLNAYAYFLLHAGQWEDALDILGLVGRMWGTAIPPRELAAIAQTTGRLNRLLVRWDRASAAYRVAEDAAQEAGDQVAALRARIGHGAVIRGQGNLPGARAVAEAVIADASRLGLRDVEGMGYAELGAVMIRQGHRVDALSAMYEAFQRTEDPVQRAAVLGDLGISLADLGSYDAARAALEMVAESPSVQFQIQTNARLELMDVESAVGNRVAFERHRAEAKHVAARMPPSMAVDYRYKIGLGLARFGQLDRAKSLWEEGRALAEAHQLNEWYFKLDRILRDAPAPAPCAPVFESDQETSKFHRVTAEIGAGLHEARELVRA